MGSAQQEVKDKDELLRRAKRLLEEVKIEMEDIKVRPSLVRQDAGGGAGGSAGGAVRAGLG